MSQLPEFTRLFLAMNTLETTPATEPGPEHDLGAREEGSHKEELFRRRHEAADALAETLIELWIADHHARTRRATPSRSETPSV